MLSKPEQILASRLEDEIKNRAVSLAQGGAKDYAEYRENCGYIEGLKMCLAELYEVNKEVTGGER